MHFEMLVLEGAQAGLSWTTIMNKRENYRRAFDGFDYEKVARYTQRDVKRLLGDAGIVRNKLKVASAISNAQMLMAVREEFGSFDEYIWGFVGGKPKVNSFRSYKDLPSSTEESDAMSKDLKKRGFRFVGTTICYAYMQSAGMVDDHEVKCFRYGR
jgi:DNA-3-methyladenine glycosylase I